MTMDDAACLIHALGCRMLDDGHKDISDALFALLASVLYAPQVPRMLESFALYATKYVNEVLETIPKEPLNCDDWPRCYPKYWSLINLECRCPLGGGVA